MTKTGRVLYELLLLGMIVVECFAEPALTAGQSAEELLQISHQNVPNNFVE